MTKTHHLLFAPLTSLCVLAAGLFSPVHVAAHAAPPLPLAKATDKGLTPSGIERIDGFFKESIQADRTPGAVVAIARNGKLVFYKSYGFVDKAQGRPMPLNAVFSLASMTKVMATVGALTFYEEGRLPLNAPVAHHASQAHDHDSGPDASHQWPDLWRPRRHPGPQVDAGLLLGCGTGDERLDISDSLGSGTLVV